MTEMKSPLYPFLSLTGDSWRNAFYVECCTCPYDRNGCDGYLLTTDTDGGPVLLPVPYFENATGERVDKAECAAIIDRNAFESLFRRWLLWNVNDPKACCLLQLAPKTEPHG